MMEVVSATAAGTAAFDETPAMPFLFSARSSSRLEEYCLSNPVLWSKHVEKPRGPGVLTIAETSPSDLTPTTAGSAEASLCQERLGILVGTR